MAVALIQNTGLDSHRSEHCLLNTLLLLSLLDLLPELEGCPLGQVQLGLHVSYLCLDFHSTILDCHCGRLLLLLFDTG